VTTPIYQRIQADIEANILSGQWPPGHRIPMERELTEVYGCSRMTVSKVLSGLAAAGMIERKRRAGSFVARPRFQSAVLHIPDIKADIEARQQLYGYELLSSRKRPASKRDAAVLKVKSLGSVLALRCRHDANNHPFALEERLINRDEVPEANSQDFSKTPPGSWLLKEVPWNEAENHITAEAANVETAAVLKIAPGTACLVVERRTWRNGEIIGFARVTFPGHLYHLVARFTPGLAK
jgi:GntR family transcriptional regulator, histidine utilization repressor